LQIVKAYAAYRFAFGGFWRCKIYMDENRIKFKVLRLNSIKRSCNHNNYIFKKIFGFHGAVLFQIEQRAPDRLQLAAYPSQYSGTMSMPIEWLRILRWSA
jgi:hypothetical protein